MNRSALGSRATRDHKLGRALAVNGVTPMNRIALFAAILLLAAAVGGCSSLPPPKYPIDPGEVFNWNP